jgi:5-amino-6-(5-phosphoribosylamino)uracil reductase
MLVLPSSSRPQITVVMAMSVDGKIADRSRAAARFGSRHDRHHLEQQIALADGVLFGATTLRAYGTSLGISSADLLQLRQQQGKPAQPVQVVCSRSGVIDPDLPFFRQPFPHWLLTTTTGAAPWQERNEFDLILTTTSTIGDVDWQHACLQFIELGIERLAVLGGGNLVESLFAQKLVDELWLTVCPLILGGVNAPTPVEGTGFLAEIAPRLELIEVRPISDELFIHYRAKPP